MITQVPLVIIIHLMSFKTTYVTSIIQGLGALLAQFSGPESCAKGGFFSESAIRFSNLQISKKKIFQKTILSLKFKFPANNSKVFLAGNLNFKFRIVFWNIFFLEIWRFKKRIALSEKKLPLTPFEHAPKQLSLPLNK